MATYNIIYGWNTFCMEAGHRVKEVHGVTGPYIDRAEVEADLQKSLDANLLAFRPFDFIEIEEII